MFLATAIYPMHPRSAVANARTGVAIPKDAVSLLRSEETCAGVLGL